MFLLSTQHKFVKIDKINKGLPETFVYNKTKSGVDMRDQLALSYSLNQVLGGGHFR